MPFVHELAARLGPELVTVPVAPSGPAGEFRAVVFYDPMDVPEFDAADLVLAVGVTADSALALQLVAARPAALVLRHDGRVGQPLLAEALSAGVALLVVPSGFSWSGVYSIASSLPEQVAPPILAESVTGTEVISDLFAVANALAATVGAPITIEDNQSRLLAYSALQGEVDAARAATILGHRVPDAFRREVRRLGVAKRMLTETQPFFLASNDPDIASRTVVTLRERDEILGSIWVVTKQPLDLRRTTALSEAARSIAIRLAHHRLTTDLQRQHRAATMALMLRGGASAVEAGRRMGLDGVDFRLAAITASTPDGGTDEALLARCESAVVQQQTLRRTGASARVDDTVYAVVPGPADHLESLAALRTMLLTARTAARPGSPELVAIGMSGPCVSLADLADAKEEADRVLQVLGDARTHDGCAEVGEVGLAVSMLRLADLESARRSAGRDVLDDVDDYDEAHAASYGQTLRVHLSSFGDHSAASQTLGVHTNTLRYRLRRLHELFGLDLTDADTRFALMVGIRLRALESRPT